MRSGIAKTLGYAGALAVTAIGGTMSLSPGWSAAGSQEQQYMSSDNPWSLASSADERQQASEAAVESSVYYSGCDEARAAGAAPIYAGQPGYREGMDGDGDGIACEPYR